MKYLATFQIRFEAFDDLEARQKMSDIIELTKICETYELEEAVNSKLEIEKKLQEITGKDIPRKIEI